MILYEKKILIENIEKAELKKIEIEENKKEVNTNIDIIKKYEKVEKKFKKNKDDTRFALKFFIIVIGGLTGIELLQHSSILAISMSILICAIANPVIFSDFLSDYVKTKREFQAFSEEEYNKLKENEENLKELSNKLEREFTNIETVINKLKIELDKIKVLEEAQKENLMDKLFYKADTEEEYELLTHAHVENYLEEYLNEPINYESIHLEVNQVNKGKSLIKKY